MVLASRYDARSPDLAIFVLTDKPISLPLVHGRGKKHISAIPFIYVMYQHYSCSAVIEGIQIIIIAV